MRNSAVHAGIALLSLPGQAVLYHTKDEEYTCGMLGPTAGSLAYTCLAGERPFDPDGANNLCQPAAMLDGLGVPVAGYASGDKILKLLSSHAPSFVLDPDSIPEFNLDKLCRQKPCRRPKCQAQATSAFHAAHCTYYHKTRPKWNVLYGYGAYEPDFSQLWDKALSSKVAGGAGSAAFPTVTDIAQTMLSRQPSILPFSFHALMDMWLLRRISDLHNAPWRDPRSHLHRPIVPPPIQPQICLNHHELSGAGHLPTVGMTLGMRQPSLAGGAPAAPGASHARPLEPQAQCGAAATRQVQARRCKAHRSPRQGTAGLERVPVTGTSIRRRLCELARASESEGESVHDSVQDADVAAEIRRVVETLRNLVALFGLTLGLRGLLDRERKVNSSLSRLLEMELENVARLQSTPLDTLASGSAFLRQERTDATLRAEPRGARGIPMSGSGLTQTAPTGSVLLASNTLQSGRLGGQKRPRHSAGAVPAAPDQPTQ